MAVDVKATYSLILTVKGTAAKDYLLSAVAGLTATCVTPSFRRERTPACSMRWHLEGTVSADSLTMLGHDIVMLGASFEHFAVCREVKAETEAESKK